MRVTDASERDGIHPLTEVILSVFWLLQLSFEGSEAFLVILQKTYALHMGHTFAFVVIDAVSKIYLM